LQRTADFVTLPISDCFFTLGSTQTEEHKMLGTFTVQGTIWFPRSHEANGKSSIALVFDALSELLQAAGTMQNVYLADSNSDMYVLQHYTED